MTTPQPCKADGRGCGTANGWRKGGRCQQCRRAHNAESNRYRGLQPDQRDRVLALLRSGSTAQQAAAAVGRTSLSAAAAHDGELRAALDGEPLPEQKAARRADLLAALARTGDRRSACEQTGVPYRALASWAKADPRFAAAVEAVLAWRTASRPSRPGRGGLTDAQVAAATATLEQAGTIAQAARAAGVSSPTLARYRGHPLLAAVWPSRGGRQRTTPEALSRAAELLAQGATIAQAAEAAGIPDSTLRRHRRTDPGLAAVWTQGKDRRGRRATPALLTRAAELLEQGTGVNATARQLGVSPLTLRSNLDRSPRLKAAWPQAAPDDRLGQPKIDAGRIRRMWQDPSLSTVEIARRLGVSQTAVAKWAKRNELPPRAAHRPGRRPKRSTQ